MKLNILKNEKIQLYFGATILFVLFSAIIFHNSLFENQSFIDAGDSLSQHYKAFVYYGRYLRTIFSNIFVKHEFLIPQFDIAIGEGSDILHSLCYYVIGDPFAFISVIFPENISYMAFGISGLLRLYAAFIAFAYMCSYFGSRNIFAIFSGCVCYCFVPASNAIEGQVFFQNPYVFLPLLIVGVNKIIRAEKPFLFITTVFFASLSNFYFFYMLVLILVLYTGIKVIFVQKENVKDVFILAGKCILYALAAFLLASFLLLPVIHVYTHDPRTSVKALRIFYDLKIYIKLPLSLTNRITVESLLAIFILFTVKNRQEKDVQLLKICFLTCFAILVFPFLCQIFNALSYPENRWAFALSLLVSYITVFCFESFQKINFIKGSIILLLFGGYCVFVSIFMKNKWPISYAKLQIPLGIFFLCCVSFSYKIAAKKYFKVINIFASVCICITVLLLNGQRFSISVERAKDVIKTNSGERVKLIAKADNETEFFRFSKTGILDDNDDVNSNMLSELSGTEYYWSLMNADILSFRKSLEICDQRHDFWYTGYDTRPVLTDLACVRYFFMADSQYIPTMYDYSATPDKNILRNENFVPFGYVYDKYILRSEFENLNPAEKEAVLSKAIVVDNPMTNTQHFFDFDVGVKKIQFTTDFKEDEIDFSCNRILAKKDNSVITFRFIVDYGVNVYLRMADMDYHRFKGKEPEWEEFKIRTNTGYEKKFDLELPRYRYYSGKTSNCVNLGYSDEIQPLSEVSIILDDAGIYDFSDFVFLSIPTKQISQELKRVSESRLENLVFKTNEIDGTILMNKNGILCIPVPYLDGWTAKVDGENIPLVKGNIMYMALELSKGHHEINLRYKTPFL